MKTNLKNKRAEKGITLIALVVTVVVLLILAGVTIITLFGENGIIKKAQTAADETNRGGLNDTTGISDLETGMNAALGIIPETTKGEMVDIETKVAKYVENGKTAYIPGGYGVVADSTTDTDNTRKVNSIANGLVISDLAGDTLDNEKNSERKQGNQFVWVPVPDINSMYDETHKVGKLYVYETKGPKVRPYSTEVSGVNSYREPDVVTYAQGSDSTTGTRYDGAVSNLNKITDFKVADGQTKTAVLFKQYLQKEFDNMIASVKKYKGFYIGRYETGNISSWTATVVQKGNDNLGDIRFKWYDIYQRTKNMTERNSNVTTSIIWGCQWDRTLNWFIETGTPITQILDSTSWGNCYDSTFTYTNNSGVETEKESKTKITVPTGSSKQNQKNHIFDMAGNNREWTMTAYSNYERVYRGGSSYDNRSVGTYEEAVPDQGSSPAGYDGYRATLYINP